MRTLAFLLSCTAAFVMAACTSAPRAPQAATETVTAAAPVAHACPPEVPAATRCFTGEDGAGAFYWIALPADWDKQVLVMHAHGGPADTGPAKLERSEEDLKRWAITVKAGYAWATYRRGGYGVTMAAEDTERLRRIVVANFGRPRRTILHGQSYGGGVAAKGAELYATMDGKRGPYDAVLLTSGVIGGGTRNYGFRLDLRVVYQYVCRNHPRPDEEQYPLWMGVPPNSKLTRAELAARIDECTGIRKPAAQRSDTQKTNLATILEVVKIPERTFVGHMNWATWLFHDVTQLRLAGRNPFDNSRTVYSGSRDDAALNAGVLRYTADPQAVAALATDSDLTGMVNVPTLTMHAIDDPTAFVELESVYRDVRERAGTAGLLVQTFTDEREHSYLSDPEYVALFASLLDWADKGDKPTPASVLARCRALEATYGAGCHLRPEFTPQALDARAARR